MSATLIQRLDAACAVHRLEWLILPCVDAPGRADRRAWRYGPYWCALLEPGLQRSGHRQFYAYNGELKGREGDPPPSVLYIHPGPLGLREAKRLLLRQIEE